MYSIVPDTNVMVSASLVSNGNPAFVIDSWRNGKIQIITSLKILDEFQRVMLENDFSMNEVEIAKAFFIWKGTVVEPKQKFDVIKEDPDDNKFLEAAVEGKADYIVSGDKDLLRLGNFAGIKIVSPAEMADILRKLQ